MVPAAYSRGSRSALTVTVVPGLPTQTGTADLSGGPVVLNFAY
ncbi:MAG: hypothetical protein Q8S02_14720 [Hydrogenophaga sp.]|nr:hypothetical protein [Hydrogenophaga sp.]